MAEYCGHCPENPTAKKPLAKVKKVSIDTDIYDKIGGGRQQIRAPQSCRTVFEMTQTFKGKKD